MKFQESDFQANDFSDWWLRSLLWNCRRISLVHITVIHVMAWCHQAISHYLSQCWPRSLLPYGITRPHCVNPFQVTATHDIVPIDEIYRYPSLSELVTLPDEWVSVWPPVQHAVVTKTHLYNVVNRTRYFFCSTLTSKRDHTRQMCELTRDAM